MILATLRELAAHVCPPLWLFGGVAVDFLAGRWTRPHGDIDLNALAGDRERIAADLRALGYDTEDTGWLTHWRQPHTGRAVEIVFLERDATGEAVLVIPEGAAIGTPGRHATVPGYLDPARWAQLEGVRFRVSHPVGEWQARRQGSGVIAGRARDPKLDHDLRVLETVIPERERLS
ncbi:MAG: hypothetical protein IAE82_17580 [Opitutaceae bacterium]|nr:hypothetical protein [Opitutaceae bacterium]